MAFAHLSYVRVVRPLSALTGSEAYPAQFGSSDLTTGSLIQLEIKLWYAGSVTLGVEYSPDGGISYRSLGSDLSLTMGRNGFSYLRLSEAVPYRNVRIVLTPDALFDGQVAVSHRGSA